MDFSNNWIWSLFNLTGGPYPPYLLEIIMKSGHSFYVHSTNTRDEESKTMILNVYDFRAMDKEDEKELKNTLDKSKREDITFEVSKLHSLLSLGRLRCGINDIQYCIEWWTRKWSLESFIPDEKKREFGFPITNTIK